MCVKSCSTSQQSTRVLLFCSVTLFLEFQMQGGHEISKRKGGYQVVKMDKNVTYRSPILYKSTQLKFRHDVHLRTAQHVGCVQWRLVLAS
jgi:hypothetical protein